MIKYRRMRNSESEECVKLATDAYFDYRYLTMYFPDDRKRWKFLESIMRLEIKLNKDSSYVITAKKDGKLAALALLSQPGHLRPSNIVYFMNGFLKIFFQCGIKDVINWINMDSTAGIPCHTLQKGAWYLSSYLVNTSMQGEGIGSRFLQECIIPFVKKKGGKKLCLFTNSEINRKFYRKNGFKEFHKQVFRYRGKSLGSWSYVMEL